MIALLLPGAVALYAGCVACLVLLLLSYRGGER